MNANRRNIFPIVVTTLLIIFVIITFFSTRYRAKLNTRVLIAQDVTRLQEIFKRIHQTCVIIDFDYQKNPINFLNVKEFTSSEVGPMNLVYPDKWEGPYVQDNPTIQAKEYQIVQTKKGYFITPGEKVTLPNGKVIGTDIILDEDADIAMMMHNPHKLMDKGIT